MILIVNLCAEKLHYFEFVLPVEDILSSRKISFFTKNYKDITSEDLFKADKIIVCGTSLMDNVYLENLDFFRPFLDFGKPILGICAGFQILGLLLEGNLKPNFMVGLFENNFDKPFLGSQGKIKTYHLHKNTIDFPQKCSLELHYFEGNLVSFADRKRNLIGVLFHPEVRNKEMILSFVRE